MKQWGLRFVVVMAVVVAGGGRASRANGGGRVGRGATGRATEGDFTGFTRGPAVLLDEEHCLTAVGVISDHNHELGESLRSMVEEFKLQEILVALDNMLGTTSQ